MDAVLDISRLEYMVVPVPYKSITEVMNVLISRLTDLFQTLLRTSESGCHRRQQKESLLQAVCNLATTLCACVHRLTRFCFC